MVALAITVVVANGWQRSNDRTKEELRRNKQDVIATRNSNVLQAILNLLRSEFQAMASFKNGSH
jgi:hypothetical protein